MKNELVGPIAHLDHTPENCDPSNLRAMCQACHLAYDAEHYAIERNANVKALLAVEDVVEAFVTSSPLVPEMIRDALHEAIERGLKERSEGNYGIRDS